MIHVIAIGGAPATGKSTLMREIMKRMPSGQFQTKDIDEGVYFVDMYNAEVFVIGKYEDGDKFPGTDRLSMSIQPHVETVMKQWHREKEFDIVVFFEGDRLFNSKTFEFMKSAGIPFYGFILRTDEDVAAQRKRPEQNDSWVAGRFTKVENLQAQYNFPVLNNSTPEQMAVNADFLWGLACRMREKKVA